MHPFLNKPKIAVHKLGIEQYFYNPRNSIFGSKDTNGMYTEVNTIIQILSRFGYDVEYLNTNVVQEDKLYDIILLFNGNPKYTSNVEKVRKHGKEVRYILTDSRYHNQAVMVGEIKYADLFLVQSESKYLETKTNIPTFNSMLHKLPIYQTLNKKRSIDPPKNGLLLFGGSIREREKQLYEYLLRPAVDLRMRYDQLGMDTRVPLKKYRELLKRATYGLVIINPLDVEIGNITWRYYEYIANNVLTFVDRESDPYERILPKELKHMYVSSYKEMLMKMNDFHNNPELKQLNIEKQRNLIKPEDITGETFVNSLVGGYKNAISGNR